MHACMHGPNGEPQSLNQMNTLTMCNYVRAPQPHTDQHRSSTCRDRGGGCSSMAAALCHCRGLPCKAGVLRAVYLDYGLCRRASPWRCVCGGGAALGLHLHYVASPLVKAVRKHGKAWCKAHVHAIYTAGQGMQPLLMACGNASGPLVVQLPSLLA